MLPIYIVSRADPDRMHTPALLNAAGIPFKLVVDDEGQVRQAKKLGYKAISTGTDNLVDKRNAITDMVKRGEWYIGMDDNIRGFTAVPAKWMKDDHIDTSDPKEQPWRKIFNTPLDTSLWLIRLQELAEYADEVGAEYGGVATMENPFFRMKRFGFRRFVKSKVFVMKGRARTRFKHRLCHDSYASAHSVALNGRVVVDQWMFYNSTWYEKGGLGSRKAREEAGLLEQLQECVNEFPGLVGLARGQNSALRFLKSSDNGVNQWRREHGFLN